MPLFEVIPKSQKGKTLLCPRCQSNLQEVNERTSGEGIGIRVREAKFRCPCGYDVEIKERFPIIQQAPAE